MIKARIWILGVVVAAGFAHAQSHADAPTAGTFRISGFAIEGRLLLKSEDFTRVVSAFVGPGKTAADIERARRALQQTYYDLGYCSTTVSLLHPEPRDGVVTFRLTEARAGEIPECLPMVALDGETKRSPATSGSKPAEVATYAYTDLRDSQEPRVKPRGSAGNAAPRQESAAPLAANTAFQKPSAAPQHKSAVDAIAPATAPSDFRAGASSPIAPRIQAPGAAADRGNAEVPSGVSVAPYVEGAGTKGLSLASDAVPIDKGSDANPAATVTQARPVPLAASAAQSGMESKISQVRAGTSSAVPADSSQSAPSAVAQAEPAKPAPAAAAPQVEPAKSAPAAVVQAEPVKPAPAVAARLAEPVKPTSAAAAPQAEPVKPVPAAVAPQAEPARPAPAAIAQAEPAKPGPAPIAQAGPVVPAPTAPPAEPSAAAPLKFSISRYIVEGNTLLKQEQIDRVLAPYSGSGKDFGDVQRALEALQLAYQKEGYGSVEIRLPEQELEKGEVKLRVVEPKVGRITVEGNEHFSEANIRHSVPDLREGETPRVREIVKNTRVANENPAKQLAVLLRAAEREDQIDATIRVADVDPKRYAISLDNTGNEDTHPLRLGLAFQNSNFLDRDHVVTAQYITSPQNFNDVMVFGLGYRIPFYSLGDSLEMVAGYSNVDSGVVQSLFNVTGQGSIYALRYNQNLSRWGDLEHRITYGLEYRAYQNDVNPVGGTAQLVPDVTVHPFSMTYSGAWRSESRGDLSFYGSFVKNIPGGSDGKDEDFRKVGVRFPDGSADYVLVRSGATYTRPFGGDWQARIRVDGQYTQYALVSGEMFAIGGADSVRGFEERYASNDKGYRTSWEIYTPDVAKAIGLDGRLRFLAFYDQGTVRRNKVQPGELTAASLDSGGLGLRLNFKTNLTLRLDAAYVFHDGTQQVEYSGRKSLVKGHFSLAWVW